MKIRWDWDKLSHTDRQTDMTKLLISFCNFAKAPKNYKIYRGENFIEKRECKEPLVRGSSRCKEPLVRGSSRCKNNYTGIFKKQDFKVLTE
jgi:hypothetical protein